MHQFIFLMIFFLIFETQALVNGTTLNGSPDVVRIRLSNGWVCSGVYLDPFTILTAAHCVSSEEKTNDLQIDRIESDGKNALDVKLVRLIPNPKYSAQYWPAYDVGIIKTTENQKFEGSFHLQERPASYTGNAILFGCGRVEYHKKAYFRTTGENSFIQLGAVLFFTGENGNIKAPIGTNVSVAPNDSGGPILDKATGGIIGVMTTTTFKQSTSYGLPTLNTGISTATESNLKFIQSNLGP